MDFFNPRDFVKHVSKEPRKSKDWAKRAQDTLEQITTSLADLDYKKKKSKAKLNEFWKKMIESIQIF